jgi:hypothetical protein
MPVPAGRPLIPRDIPPSMAATIWTRFEQVRNDWAAASGVVPESADGEGMQWRKQLW